jgi:hypothetical protein
MHALEERISVKNKKALRLYEVLLFLYGDETSVKTNIRK